MKESLLNRAHYPSPEKAIYLNQASLGLVGQPAAQAMHRFLDDVGVDSKRQSRLNEP